MSGIIIDLVIIAFAALCAYRGFRAGLVRGAAGFLALILSLFLANAASEAFSGEFTGVLRPFVGGLVDGKLQSILSPQETGGDAEEEAPLPDEEEYDVTTARGLTLLTLRKLGFFKSAAEKIAGAIKTESEEAGYALGSMITDKLCKALARVAVFAAAFILLSIVFAVAGNLMNFVFSLPGLRQLDALAGLAAGLLRGALVILFAAAVLRYFGLVTAGTIEKTKLLRYIVDHNIIADALGI
ncbi:MAG: CvpA family protein [Oscillospiraceae bacterium]|nr:CvpA family protein [Oscillospiraceae bacterium]